MVLGGLALDYCVKATALDLRNKMSLDVTVIADATAAVAPQSAAEALKEMERAGILIVDTATLIQ